MDKRNSKESLLNQIDRLSNKVDKVYDAGYWGIGHVGQANYASREIEATNKLDDAMYEDFK